MEPVSPPAVEVRDLVKVYPRPGGGTLRALDGISFQVAVGEFFGFLGPNGAGKTTALEIIEVSADQLLVRCGCWGSTRETTSIG